MNKYEYGNSDSQTILIQTIDEHDLSLLEKQYTLIKDYTDHEFLLCAYKVDDWNSDLSPWIAEPVFGKAPFGNNAQNTLNEILKDLKQYKDKTIILGGYSLAGLFALWAAYNCDIFDGIAAASPSVWFPNFMEYAKQNAIHTNNIYLSLGDKEEKTKNPIMSKVGENIKELYNHYNSLENMNVILEWNQGNHFVDSDLRMAKGFAWIINSIYTKNKTLV